MHLLNVLRLPRSTRWVVAVAAVAVGAALLASLDSASARARFKHPISKPAPHIVDFSEVRAQYPIAGQMFEGMVIINRTGLTGRPRRFTSVACDAALGTDRLPAKLLTYGKLRHRYLQVIVCGWDIPSDAAGKTLGLVDRRASVNFGDNEIVGAAFVTWKVRAS